MPYLDRFANDIFLSYGWSGNLDESAGDRGWVSGFRDRLRLELVQMLRLRSPDVSIFVDLNSPRNGDTEERFQSYLRESGIFLAIVTPGFCLPEGFCRKELSWFSRDARPISSSALDVKKRIFKIIRRPVMDNDQPEMIRKLSPYLFYESDPLPRTDLYKTDLYNYRPLAVSAIDQLPTSRISTEFSKLVSDLANFLVECKRSQDDYPVKRVFFAESDCAEKAQVIEAIRNHDIISCPKTPDMSEEEFIVQTDQILANSDCSVHLIGTSASLSDPPNWRHSVLANQLLCAQRIEKENFRYIVWCSAQIPADDVGLKQLMAQVGPSGAKSSRVDYIPLGIQYLIENLQLRISRGLTKAPTLEPAPSGKRVFVQCAREDIPRLLPALRKLNSLGIGYRTQAFDGRFKKQVNRQLLNETDGTLVYWGKTSDSEMFMACNFAIEVYGSNLDRKKRIIGIDPPNDYRRMVFTHPKFSTMPFPADQLSEQDLRDAFL